MIIIEEECVQIITRTQEERGEIIGLMTHAKGRKRWETKDKNQTCSNCSRSGHTTESCFQLIGYPEWWGERPKTDGKTSGKTKMLHRSGVGRGRGSSLKANVAQAHAIGGAVEPIQTQKNLVLPD